MRSRATHAAKTVAKFLLHQPLNRQSATYAREGVEIDPSTLADRVVVALDPVICAIHDHVLAAGRIQITGEMMLCISVRSLLGTGWTSASNCAMAEQTVTCRWRTMKKRLSTAGREGAN